MFGNNDKLTLTLINAKNIKGESCMKKILVLLMAHLLLFTKKQHLYKEEEVNGKG